MRRHIPVQGVSLGVCTLRRPPKGIHNYERTSSENGMLNEKDSGRTAVRQT
jgi:hypothetical protein